jgi:hypothetical protein
MRQSGSWGWWGILLCGAAACGQELVLPTGDAHETEPAGDAPSDGVTGAAGDRAEARPGSRLPVVDQPVFTTFGGAGADGAGAGGAEQVVASSPRGGAAGAGTKPSNDAGAAGTGVLDAGGSGGADGGPLGPAKLLFSEYLEGSGSFKALEIYALEASSLEGCALETYFNGKLEPTRLALHGQLASGDVQVLCSPTLATAQPTVCDRSTSLTFNGDDALALSCDGQTLDVIGQVGADPGDGWSLGATLDHTLRRRCSVTSGRIDGGQAFDVDAEWLTLSVDSFADLGVRSCVER